MGKEGSADAHLVVVLVNGAEAWRIDSRETPILMVETALSAVEAVKAALHPKAVPATACCAVS